MSMLRVKSFAAQSYNSLFHIECLFLLQSYSPCIQKTPIVGGSLPRDDFDESNHSLGTEHAAPRFCFRQDPAPGPTATTKYVAGVVPTFLIPCSSFECTKPTEPGPRR